MEVNPRKKLTSTGVICELVKTKSQENYLSGVQSNAMLDLDLDLDLGKDSVHVSSTSSGSNERQLLSEIELMLVEHPEGVRKEKQKVINTILNMREKINRLRQMAENVEKYDIKTYRERALDVENSLTDLYNNNLFRLGQLKCDQMDILASLPDSSELLKEESKYTAKRSTRPKKRSNRTEEADNIPTTQSHYYRAVKDFDNFLKANGGHTGGWNEEQHSVYVALHAKYKNNAIKVENALREILPDLDSDTIQQHDKWFKMYRNLKMNRKVAIEQWRQERDD